MLRGIRTTKKHLNQQQECPTREAPKAPSKPIKIPCKNNLLRHVLQTMSIEALAPEAD
jgi:hypothetical protein